MLAVLWRNYAKILIPIMREVMKCHLPAADGGLLKNGPKVKLYSGKMCVREML